MLVLFLVIWHSSHLDMSDFLILLVFAYLITSLWVINAVDSSIKKSSSQTAVGMKSWGLCHSTLITGLGKEIRGFAGSSVYLFFLYIFIAFTSKRKKKSCCFVTERVHNRNQFRGQCGYGKINKKIYWHNTAHGFCISSERYMTTCHIYPSF